VGAGALAGEEAEGEEEGEEEEGVANVPATDASSSSDESKEILAIILDRFLFLRGWWGCELLGGGGVRVKRRAPTAAGRVRLSPTAGRRGRTREQEKESPGGARFEGFRRRHAVAPAVFKLLATSIEGTLQLYETMKFLLKF